MLINRLAILLAERTLSGSRLSVETGIAQSTISKITSNKSKQVDYATVNTICNNLQITPNDFFDYSPFDYDISCLKDEEDGSIKLFIKVKKFDVKICTLEYHSKAYYYINQDKPNSVDSGVSIFEIKNDYEKVEKILVQLILSKVNTESCEEFENLPINFKNILKNDLLEKVGIVLKSDLVEEFNEKFIFEKNSIGGVDLSNFNKSEYKNSIDLWIKSNVTPIPIIDDFPF